MNLVGRHFAAGLVLAGTLLTAGVVQAQPTTLQAQIEGMRNRLGAGLPAAVRTALAQGDANAIRQAIMAASGNDPEEAADLARQVANVGGATNDAAALSAAMAIAELPAVQQAAPSAVARLVGVVANEARQQIRVGNDPNGFADLALRGLDVMTTPTMGAGTSTALMRKVLGSVQLALLARPPNPPTNWVSREPVLVARLTALQLDNRLDAQFRQEIARLQRDLPSARASANDDNAGGDGTGNGDPPPGNQNERNGTDS